MPKSRPRLPPAARRRWTRADARTVLEAMDRSGLGVAAFAAREGLDAQRVYFWRRRLRATEERAITPAFVEVKPWVAEHAPVEIVLRSGRILRVTASIDGEALRRIADALDEDPPC